MTSFNKKIQCSLIIESNKSQVKLCHLNSLHVVEKKSKVEKYSKISIVQDTKNNRLFPLSTGRVKLKNTVKYQFQSLYAVNCKKVNRLVSQIKLNF